MTDIEQNRYFRGWAIPGECPRAERVLDLGSGIGSVGMSAAWRLPGARFVTVEAQAQSVELARKSALYNRLSDRYEIRQGDFRNENVINLEEKFNLIFGSPPYFPLGTGAISAHPQKAACRFELRGSVVDYCLVAARHLDYGGVFSCVFPMSPVSQLERVLEGKKAANLAIIRRRPVALKEGDDPLLCLFLMMRRTDLPESFRDQTWVEPTLIIRQLDGKTHSEYSAIKLSMGLPP